MRFSVQTPQRPVLIKWLITTGVLVGLLSPLCKGGDLHWRLTQLFSQTAAQRTHHNRNMFHLRGNGEHTLSKRMKTR